jgi:hypothetical protein
VDLWLRFFVSLWGPCPRGLKEILFYREDLHLRRRAQNKVGRVAPRPGSVCRSATADEPRDSIKLGRKPLTKFWITTLSGLAGQ